MSGKLPFITMQVADRLYSFWSPGGGGYYSSFHPHQPHLVGSTGLDSSQQLSSGPTSSPWEASHHISLFLGIT